MKTANTLAEFETWNETRITSPTNAATYFFNYILLKLASHCNISCTYCYWFKDKSVYEKPAILTLDAEDAFIFRLEQHIKASKLKDFNILFHGGEPMLIGKARFDIFCRKLRDLEKRMSFDLSLAITTNGVLIDEEWARLFLSHRVDVGVSLDGPQKIHDSRRVDHKQRGTFDRVMKSIQILQNCGVDPGVLAVCDPDSDPDEVFDFFSNELRMKSFDVLIPDANHESTPSSIARYYKRLFDMWYSYPNKPRIKIRLIENIIKGMFGVSSRSESIGHGPIRTFTMLTDGSLEPLDVLRIAGDNFTQTKFSIFDNALQEIQSDPLWSEVVEASMNLAEPCTKCKYRFACGGGHISSRWSNVSRFDNPSVYCSDFIELFDHIHARVFQQSHTAI